MAAAELGQLFWGEFAAAEACLCARVGCTMVGKTAAQTAAAGEVTSFQVAFLRKPDTMSTMQCMETKNTADRWRPCCTPENHNKEALGIGRGSCSCKGCTKRHTLKKSYQVMLQKLGACVR